MMTIAICRVKGIRSQNPRPHASMTCPRVEGVAATPAFINAIQEYNLLESFTLDIAFSDGNKHRFAGFHTIQEDRLKQLGPEALGKLHSHGHLQAVYMVIASLSHFRELIERASRLDAAQR